MIPLWLLKFGHFCFRSPGNIPRHFESKYDECFISPYLSLNYNTKLTAKRQVIKHRHKSLQQCHSNTDFLSEHFLLEKSKELLKINLVFRFSLLDESFLLKVNRPWLCVSNLIISTKTWRKTPIDEYILRNIVQAAY